MYMIDFVSMTMDMDSRCLLILALIYGVITFKVKAHGCPSGWLQHEQLCYKFSTETAILKKAKLLCGQMDATLVTVSDNSINTLIKENMQGPTWIGLIEDTTSWAWANPSAFYSYENWNTYQERVKSPCVAMAKNGSWFGLPCNTTLLHFCEKLPQLSGCDMTYESHGLFCYRKSITALNWVSSSTICNPDGYLPSIVDSSTTNFLTAKMDSDELVWLGLTTLKWVSGERYSFQRWDAPDHMPSVPLCVAIVQKPDGRALWQNTDCGNSVHYVCEKKELTTSTLASPIVIDDNISTTQTIHTNSKISQDATTSAIMNTRNGDIRRSSTVKHIQQYPTTSTLTPNENEVSQLSLVLGIIGAIVIIIIVSLIVVIILLVRKTRNKSRSPIGLTNVEYENATGITINDTTSDNYVDVTSMVNNNVTVDQYENVTSNEYEAMATFTPTRNIYEHIAVPNHISET